jgi:hypothetical protein
MKFELEWLPILEAPKEINILVCVPVRDTYYVTIARLTEKAGEFGWYKINNGKKGYINPRYFALLPKPVKNGE